MKLNLVMSALLLLGSFSCKSSSSGNTDSGLESIKSSTLLEKTENQAMTFNNLQLQPGNLGQPSQRPTLWQNGHVDLEGQIPSSGSYCLVDRSLGGNVAKANGKYVVDSVVVKNYDHGIKGVRLSFRSVGGIVPVNLECRSKDVEPTVGDLKSALDSSITIP